MTDNFKTVKEAVSLKEYAEATLAKGRGGYICPNPKCNSGGHGTATSDSAFSIKDNRTWKCFSCEAGGDVFDLAGYVNGTDSKAEQLRIIAEWAGITLQDSPGEATRPAERPRSNAGVDTSKAAEIYEGQDHEERFIKAAQDAMNTCDAAPAREYLKARGFTDEEIGRFGFGFDANTKSGWKNKAGQWVNGARVVIPWRGSRHYHVDRAVSDDVSERKYTKPKSEKTGPQPVLENPEALKNDVVFIVEGLLDALSVEAMGYSSIALCGTSYENTLSSIASRDYAGIVVLMFDGDGPGRAAQDKAAVFAGRLNLHHYEADLTGMIGCKDACEAMAKDRQAAGEALKEITQAAKAQERERAERERAAVMEQLSIKDPAEIVAAIYECQGYDAPTPTGISVLDKAINGGLRTGLTVLGAVSSAGKTTLCVQMADNMAEAGRPVLFVSIEQSARELVSKSISRMMAGRGYKSVPAWAMSDESEREKWTDEKQLAMAEVCQEYMNRIAPNIDYLSANEQPTVDRIEKAMAYSKAKHGVSPVVFIDYLQLLAPKSDRDTDKRAADYNVSQLRRIARDMKSPIVCISSLNRGSYSGSIEMESFKESGGIEYGADLLLGLQPAGIQDRLSEEKSDEARRRAAKDATHSFKLMTVRECEIVVLKNRNGAMPAYPLPVKFDCSSSQFY